jgi:hypothetical protein
VDHLGFFFLVRLVLSTIYSAIASYLINSWFRNRPYKTYLERDRENFSFFNIYFLINMIVADFYGIIIIGIQGMGSGKSDETLERYHSYLFTSALKVTLSLIFSPYLVKLLDYIPKIWAFLRVYLYDNYKVGPATTIMNKIKRDMPVRHNIHDMSTYICQCLFFITFFLPFMIPLLNIVLLLSLYLFRIVERYLILNHHSLQRSIHFTSILSIYKVSLIGFLLLQVLNFSNSNIVMKFISLFSINTENIEIEANLLNFMLLIVRKIFNILANFSDYKELGQNVVILSLIHI